MSRTIKFRAWDKEQKRLVYDFETVPYFASRVITKYSEKYCMQYTGLKDKNGVEIYEGDIVDLTDDNWWAASGPAGFDSKVQRVEWVESTTGFAPFAIYDTDCGVEQDASKCEVIGNIWENPELLTNKGDTNETK